MGGLPVLVLLLAAAPEAPIDRGLGQRIGDFALPGIHGRVVRLDSFRERKAIVLVFTGTECPVGNLYMPRLVELARRFEPRGVAFLAINANASEPMARVAAHARAHGVTFPVLKDDRHLAADLALAERTCEVVVLDARRKIRYRGAIDDQYGLGTRKPGPSRSFLADALEAILAGRPVEPAATPVAGCPIERADLPAPPKPRTPRIRPAPAEVVAAYDERDGPVRLGRVTYASDVAAILQAKCQGCHRPGQVGPFSLRNGADARRWSAAIAEAVESRRMPPWHADPRFGRFRNDRSLTARERATLLAWVEQGTPLGDPRKLPPPRTYPEGWTIGTPDAVFEIPRPYEVPAQGTLDYVFLRVPTNYTEDRWIQAVEVQPGDRSVIHHIILFAEPHRGAPAGDPDPASGRPWTHIVGYTPGDVASSYPPGVAKRLPAGSDLIFEIHYTPNGLRRTDRSRVGFVFAREPVRRAVATYGILNSNFCIPPREANFPVQASLHIDHDVHLIHLAPHMHVRGKDFTFTAATPDGRREVLLSVPAYDFAWQSVYILAEPKRLPKGTRIDALAHFDNSAKNPNNPDPNVPVLWGGQSYQEMMLGFIDLATDLPHPAESRRGE